MSLVKQTVLLDGQAPVRRIDCRCLCLLIAVACRVVELLNGLLEGKVLEEVRMDLH